MAKKAGELKRRVLKLACISSDVVVLRHVKQTWQRPVRQEEHQGERKVTDAPA